MTAGTPCLNLPLRSESEAEFRKRKLDEMQCIEVCNIVAQQFLGVWAKGASLRDAVPENPRHTEARAVALYLCNAHVIPGITFLQAYFHMRDQQECAGWLNKIAYQIEFSVATEFAVDRAAKACEEVLP